MGEQKKNKKNVVNEIVYRVLIASLKAILIYVVYLLVITLIAPITEFIPDLVGSIEAFVIIFIALMFLSDLTKNTIFQYFFNTARQIFVIGYLLLSMSDGIMSLSYENLMLTVNLTIFYGIAVTLSLLGFARSILQAIEFMSRKTEKEIGFQSIQNT